jgi:hypothetical protein
VLHKKSRIVVVIHIEEVQREEDKCGCFGESKKHTHTTLANNFVTTLSFEKFGLALWTLSYKSFSHFFFNCFSKFSLLKKKTIASTLSKDKSNISKGKERNENLTSCFFSTSSQRKGM